MTSNPPGPRGVQRSERLFRFFARYAARYLRRHMHAMRLANWGGRPEGTDGRPLVIYSNHPSWWDALVYILLADRLFPKRKGYAPMDGEMLDRYRLFRRLGAFAVEPDSLAGARAFLATARTVLEDRDAILFVSATGRFVDARVRPQGMKAGVARIPELAPEAVLVPLAIELTFWDERKPELLLAFGEVTTAASLDLESRQARLDRLQSRLHQTMDRLSQDAESRDPSRFTSLLSSASGVGGLYDLWGRVRAGLRGRRYDPSHRGGVR